MNNFRSVNPIKRKITNIILIILILLATLFLMYKLYDNRSTINGFFNPIDLGDKTPPKLSTVTIKSDNKYNTKYAEEGNTISLDFVPNEELSNLPTVKINDKEVSVYKREGYYSAYYTVLSQSLVNIDVKFEISNYKDRNGNIGEIVSNTTDGSSVSIVSSGTSIEDLTKNS